MVRAANSANEIPRSTPLIFAAASGDANGVFALVMSRVDINAQDEHGATALMYATAFERVEIVSILLKAGADPRLIDRNGRTAGEISRRLINNEISEMLNAAARLLDSKDRKGRSSHGPETTGPIQTHYDNLRVSRNAPIEVIRAAYRALSQRHHPDRNSADPEATRIMTIINTAYETLSDPIKRAKHDDWIRRMEREPRENSTESTPSRDTVAHDFQTDPVEVHLRRYWWLYGLCGLIAWAILSSGGGTKSSSYQPGPPVTTPATPSEPLPAPLSEKSWLDEAEAAAGVSQSGPPTKADGVPVESPGKRSAAREQPSYTRPLEAPNGEPWPIGSAYVNGYRRLHLDGRSSVTIDNTQNDSDVFAKLVYIEGGDPLAVRVFFLKGKDKFTLSNVRAGGYDFRYRDLDSGAISKSPPFELNETRVAGGIEYSRYTMTLYKVRDGNMRMQSITENEF